LFWVVFLTTERTEYTEIFLRLLLGVQHSRWRMSNWLAAWRDAT